MTKAEKTSAIPVIQALLQRAQEKMTQMAPMGMAPMASPFPEVAELDAADAAREAGEGEAEAVPYFAKAAQVLAAVLA